MILALFVFLAGEAFAAQIVTTLPWLGDIAQQVAPEAQVTVLARGTDDPHVLSPTPALIAKVSSADLYVENGMSLELWSERLLDAAGNPGIRPGQAGYVLATQGMQRLAVPSDLSRARGDLHPEGNPHVWTDPLNAPVAADNIAAGLARIDPVNAEQYTANAARFRRRIEEATFGADLVDFMGGELLTRLERGHQLRPFLEKKGLQDSLGGWLKAGESLRGKPVVFYHQSWAYLIERFGLELVGTVEDRPGINPTAAHRDELLSLIRAREVGIIAVTSYYDARIPKLLGEQSGAAVVTLPGDVGGVPEAKDYFAFIDALLSRLAG